MSTDERQAPLDLDTISFRGTDGEDASLFLSNVKKFALLQGRQRDDDWLIDCMASCLAGGALTWFLEFHYDCPAGWNAVQRALLKQFPLKPRSAAAPAAAAISGQRPAIAVQSRWFAPSPNAVPTQKSDVLNWASEKASPDFIPGAQQTHRCPFTANRY